MFEQDSPGYLSGTHTMGAPAGFNQPTHTAPPRHFSDVIRVGYGSQDAVAPQNGQTVAAQTVAAAPPVAPPAPQQNGQKPNPLKTGMNLIGTLFKVGSHAIGVGVASGVVGMTIAESDFKDGFKIGAYGAVIYGVAGLILKGAVKSNQQ